MHFKRLKRFGYINCIVTIDDLINRSDVLDVFSFLGLLLLYLMFLLLYLCMMCVCRILIKITYLLNRLTSCRPKIPGRTRRDPVGLGHITNCPSVGWV